MKKGISLIILIITIVIIIILVGIVILSIMENDSIISKSQDSVYAQSIASKDETIILNEMTRSINGYDTKKDAKISADYIQPWMCGNWTDADFDVYFQKLKDSNIDMSILQYSIDAKVIDGKAQITQKFFWENTANPFNSQIKIKLNVNCINSAYDVVHSFIKSANKHGIKVFIGLANVGQWFEEKFIDSTWRNEINSINNLMVEYLMAEYKVKYPDTFCGVYYPLEFYTNNKNYEQLYWNSMLKSTRDHLINVQTKYSADMTFFISTYCSDLNEYEIKGNDNAEVKAKMMSSFDKLIANDAIRPGDIVCPQDKIATMEKRNVEYSILYLEALRDSVKNKNGNNQKKIEYWINVENFNYIPNPITGIVETGNINRVIAQISIANSYADKLAFFSYAHYYMELNAAGKPISSLGQKEKEFVDFIKSK